MDSLGKFNFENEFKISYECLEKFLFFFLNVTGFWTEAYTLSQYTSPFFGMGFFRGRVYPNIG
jgi:hypothetical protein